MTFQRILFPVDFSDRCTHAAQYVAHIARKFNSELFLLHAIEPASLFSSVPEVAIPAISGYELTIERLQERLDQFGQEEFHGLTVTRMLKPDEPARAITNYAAQNKIGLIIMPTHGRGAFRRLLLGSITSKVLHDANCAVLTTAHSETLPSNSGELHSIICAVDLGDENTHIIRKAAELAKLYEAQVRLVHAVPLPPPTTEFPVDPSFEDDLIAEAHKNLGELQNQCGTHWDICVHTGDVGAVIGSAARGHKADLVVIGRGKLNRRFGQLRTHVSSIIRQSPCAVLSVPNNG